MVQVRLGLADAAQAGRRRRRRRAGALPPGHGTAAGGGRTAAAAAEAWRDGDDRLAAGNRAGAGDRRAGAPRGRRRRLPGHRDAPHPRGAGADPGAFLHVHHHIREDAQTLYGFPAGASGPRSTILIATHGVGPALALAILATHTPSALVDIVASSDLASLCLVPGVGQEDGRATAGRAAQPAVRAGARRRLAGRFVLRGRRRAGGAGRARATAARRSARRCGRSTRPTHAEALLRDALARCWGPAVRDEFLDPAPADEREEAEDASLRPRRLDDFVGQRGAEGAPVGRAGGRPPPGPGRGPPAVRRAARRRQDLAVGHRGGRDGGPASRHLRPGAGAGRRPGRHPHQARRRRRPLHRRDPPALARRRGDPLPGHGGLPARHRGRARGRRPPPSG